MSQDILYKAAEEYARLKSVAYEIKLGRKGKEYDLLLHFPYDSFFHLIGLQHLEDLTFPSKNTERIFKEIRNGNITVDFLKKSPYYEPFKIEERMTNLYLIENIIENNKVAYKINPTEYIKYTSIKAEYLLEYKDIMDTFYLFLVEEKQNPRFEKEHKCCSFFKKDNFDYTVRTAKTTLLLLNKIEDFGTTSERKIEIYRNPSYKPKEQ